MSRTDNADLSAGIEKSVPIPQKRVAKKEPYSERVKIFIDESGNPKDPQYVKVGHNGKMFQIKRGMAVDVPTEVLSVLEDAVESRLVNIGDENRPEWILKSFLRYPFRRVG